MVSVVAYVQKDFYLLPEIDATIHTLTAAGLIQYWNRQVADPSKRLKANLSHPKVLKLNDLLACFQILVLGAVTGFFVFILEILMFRWNNRVKL